MSIELVKIEKSVAIPRGLGGRVPVYPWNELEVGDSFLARTKNVAVTAYNKNLAPKRFVSRFENGKRRVWRVA